MSVVLLVVVTLALYAQVASHGYILFDDDDYILNNPVVNQGVNWSAVYAAFTQVHLSNWHPLTTLSMMLDVERFGMDFGSHHLVNLFFHTLNSLVLFIFLKEITRKHWFLMLVAMLFALHPAHVESVAWLSERKNVLSTLFFLLTIWSYHRYKNSNNRVQYWFSVWFLALGLMSKPMLVTVTFVLLLLDLWPLNRLGDGKSITGNEIIKLIVEKWPHFLLISVPVVITYLVQHDSGAMEQDSHDAYFILGKVFQKQANYQLAYAMNANSLS